MACPCKRCVEKGRVEKCSKKAAANYREWKLAFNKDNKELLEQLEEGTI